VQTLGTGARIRCSEVERRVRGRRYEGVSRGAPAAAVVEDRKVATETDTACFGRLKWVVDDGKVGMGPCDAAALEDV